MFITFMILFQFEDFANHNAFDLLARYSSSHLVFNDDIQVACLKDFDYVHFSLYYFRLLTLIFLGLIQGTASVVLAGLLASLKLIGGTLADHTFLFLGAGEVSA